MIQVISPSNFIKTPIFRGSLMLIIKVLCISIKHNVLSRTQPLKTHVMGNKAIGIQIEQLAFILLCSLIKVDDIAQNCASMLSVRCHLIS